MPRQIAGGRTRSGPGYPQPGRHGTCSGRGRPADRDLRGCLRPHDGLTGHAGQPQCDNTYLPQTRCRQDTAGRSTQTTLRAGGLVALVWIGTAAAVFLGTRYASRQAALRNVAPEIFMPAMVSIGVVVLGVILLVHTLSPQHVRTGFDHWSIAAGIAAVGTGALSALALLWSQVRQGRRRRPHEQNADEVP